MAEEPERALVLHPDDGVATALADLARGERVIVTGDRVVVVRDDVPFGHKFALRAIRAGDVVLKYGQPIGLARADVAEGEWVHLHNLASLREADGAG